MEGVTGGSLHSLLSPLSLLPPSLLSLTFTCSSSFHLDDHTKLDDTEGETTHVAKSFHHIAAIFVLHVAVIPNRIPGRSLYLCTLFLHHRSEKKYLPRFIVPRCFAREFVDFLCNRYYRSDRSLVLRNHRCIDDSRTLLSASLTRDFDWSSRIIRWTSLDVVRIQFHAEWIVNGHEFAPQSGTEGVV